MDMRVASILLFNRIDGADTSNVRVRLVDALYPKALQQLRSGELDLALGPLPATGLGPDLAVLPLSMVMQQVQAGQAQVSLDMAGFLFISLSGDSITAPPQTMAATARCEHSKD